MLKAGVMLVCLATLVASCGNEEKGDADESSLAGKQCKPLSFISCKSVPGRVAAASKLASMPRDARAVPLFVKGLSDTDAEVRVISANALPRQVDMRTTSSLRTRALQGLKKASETDKDPRVRAAARASFDQIRAASEAKPEVVIAVGEGASKVDGAGAGPIVAMMNALAKGLEADSLKGWRVAPQGAVSVGRIRAHGAQAFFVDATITALTSADGTTSCALSALVATFPEKALFGVDEEKGSAAGAGDEAATECLGELAKAAGGKLAATIRKRVSGAPPE